VRIREACLVDQGRAFGLDLVEIGGVRVASGSYVYADADGIVEVKAALRGLVTNYQLIEQTRASRLAAAENLRTLMVEEETTRALTPEFLDLKLRRQETLAQTELGEALARTDFTHEADTAAAATGLKHVTPLIERGTCADFDWYTMPFSQDGNFRAHLAAAPSQAGLNILADAATGLHQLHQHGIVHRDVYQENILIHQGRGHITDLGASRRAHTPRGPRSRGPEVHWAPEYATDYTQATPAADVYSLAVLVHRYLTGDIPRLHHEQPGLPPDLRGLLRASLAPAPHDRPAVPELRDALQEHAHNFSH